MKKCNHKTEVFSRVVGFFRPIGEWNKGKKEEQKDRKNLLIKDEVIKRIEINSEKK